jgi:hypothetical protein
VEPLRLDLWTNNGPTVTGRRPVRASVTHPATGDEACVPDSAALRDLLKAVAGNGAVIAVAEITDPDPA